METQKLFRPFCCRGMRAAETSIRVSSVLCLQLPSNHCGFVWYSGPEWHRLTPDRTGRKQTCEKHYDNDEQHQEYDDYHHDAADDDDDEEWKYRVVQTRCFIFQLQAQPKTVPSPRYLRPSMLSKQTTGGLSCCAAG